MGALYRPNVAQLPVAKAMTVWMESLEQAVESKASHDFLRKIVAIDSTKLVVR